MLSLAQLTRLAHALRDQRVLTVYVDGSASDPAVQRSWHVQIDNALKDLRGWLADSPHDEREAFEDTLRRVASPMTELFQEKQVTFFTLSAKSGTRRSMKRRERTPTP